MLSGDGKSLLKKVIKIMEKTVIKTSKILDFLPKYIDENILGIIIKIQKGFTIPPVRYSKKLS